MNIASWLLALVTPILGRLMVALGASLVTYIGVTEGIRTLIDHAKTAYSGLPSAVLGLAGLAGVNEGLGLILGALVARAALWAIGNSTKWVFTK